MFENINISVSLTGLSSISSSRSVLYSDFISVSLSCSLGKSACDSIQLLIPDNYQYTYEDINQQYSLFNISVVTNSIRLGIINLALTLLFFCNRLFPSLLCFLSFVNNVVVHRICRGFDIQCELSKYFLSSC